MPSDPPREPQTNAEGAGGATAGARADFTVPRRLHPASIVLGVNLRQLAQALIFPVLAGFAAGGIMTLGFIVFFGLVGLVVRGLAWQRFAFSFDGEVVRVDEGILSRNRRALDVARIQQVELDRSALQRLFGLAALRIETAGSSSEVEVELSVLPEADAMALRDAVRAGRARALADQRARRPSARGRGVGPSVVDAAAGSGDGSAGGEELGHDGLAHELGRAPSREVGRVPLRHVALAAVTGAQLLVFPAVVAAAFQFVGELSTTYLNRALEQAVETGLVSPRELVAGPRWTTVVLIVLATVALSIATALVVGVLRDANFVVTRTGDDLHVSRGLLSTRDSVVPLRRVQLVEIHRNWARRLFGAATIRIHSAGGSTDAARRVALPLVLERDVDRWLGELLPGVEGTPPLRTHPSTALRRAVLRWVRPALLAPVVAWGLWWSLPDEVLAVLPPWIDTARWWTLALVPTAAALGAIEYRHLAHGVSTRVLASRQGALSITTSLAPLVKVQATSTRRSVFQRRLGLSTVTAHVAGPGGDVHILDADVTTSAELHGELTRHAASPAVADLTDPATPAS
jgi:putative membrane protein